MSSLEVALGPCGRDEVLVRYVEFVALLVPSPDPAESLRVLRERCDRDKGTDWIRDGHDYLEGWIGSRQNLSLADLVVFGDGRSASDIARQIASAVTVDPA